ncbi:MAG: ATP-binding cassette domain-containing protein [Clostridiales bacterium]|nr:ATP-binding cassette domain-containing protein [Clostridiales bacterium]
MIVFDDVHVSFGKLEVLRGINLEIETGSKTVIIAPSGSGKSTLLQAIKTAEDIMAIYFLTALLYYLLNVTFSTLARRSKENASKGLGQIIIASATKKRLQRETSVK